jgi:predicted RNA-binding Zn ribbon-like protein
MQLWLELIHSDWQDHLGRQSAGDRLDDPAWLATFLAQGGLPHVATRDGRLGCALKELRAVIRDAVTGCLDGGKVRDKALQRLNGYLHQTPIRPSLERTGKGYRMRLQPDGGRLERALFLIASSFAEFLAGGDVARLRVCDNPTCGWVFLDRTRSRTGRWCGSTCRSLIKVRALRRRKKRLRKK